jgi:hypothetical protein
MEAGTVPRIEIADFAISQRAAAKMWDHRISVDQLYDVLDNPYVVDRNRANRRAPYILIGRDNQGRCPAAPIVPTDDPLIWRPITAWYCKPSEAAKLGRGRRIMEQPTRYESLQEPLDDEERELMDPGSWDWNSQVDVSMVGTPGAILEIRFTRDEIMRLGPLARAEGVTVHEFVKRAALSRVPERASR